MSLCLGQCGFGAVLVCLGVVVYRRPILRAWCAGCTGGEGNPTVTPKAECDTKKNIRRTAGDGVWEEEAHNGGAVREG